MEETALLNSVRTVLYRKHNANDYNEPITDKSTNTATSFLRSGEMALRKSPTTVFGLLKLS